MSEAIRFVNGDPNEEEVAVVLALISSGVAAPAVEHPPPVAQQGFSAWGRPRHMRSRPRNWAESRLP